MLRGRARLLREAADEEDLAELEAELRELVIKIFELDVDTAKIDNWTKQLTKCVETLRTMQQNLHRAGESQPLALDQPLTMPPYPVPHSSM